MTDDTKALVERLRMFGGGNEPPTMLDLEAASLIEQQAARIEALRAVMEELEDCADTLSVCFHAPDATAEQVEKWTADGIAELRAIISRAKEARKP